MRNPAEFRGATAALAVVLACALIWSLVPAVLLSAPHGDNVEQLNWSHGLQWGYLKHPPLPTCRKTVLHGHTIFDIDVD